MDSEAKRFVIQEHRSGGGVHWDLMLERGSVLETWRIGCGPLEMIGATKVSAVKIFDHALKFLSFEGALSGDKGSVQIADKGTYQIKAETRQKIEAEFTGGILKGVFTLSHLQGDSWEFSAKGAES